MIIPEAASNSLIIIAKSFYIDKISEMIRKLDKAPKQVVIQVIIQEIDADGKVTVLSRPQVMTIDGNQAAIEVGSTERRLRIELTPRIILQDDEEEEKDLFVEVLLSDDLSTPLYLKDTTAQPFQL